MGSHRNSPAMSRAISGYREREKAEQELFQSVKKAVNTDETAPKQKHVRVATLFTWDFKNANSFWQSLKSQPILSDDIQCFKALITIHKVMRDGHPSALEATMREVPFLDTMAKNSTMTFTRGYASLIQAYIGFIKNKLEFHTFHPEFTANLDYEEYRALRKVDDPNEGYNTITELMNLQDKLDQLQKTVFGSFRPSANNECRIAALVPLVEESYGIYKFITSMLTAMHSVVSAHSALEPLRSRYRDQYNMLRDFYFECTNLRYLTSLITVPNLPALPSDFIRTTTTSQSLDNLAPREKTPPPEDLWGSITSMTPEPDFGPQATEFSQQQQNQQLVVLSSSSSQQVTHYQGQQQPPQQQQNPFHNEVNTLRHQNMQAQQLLAGYEGRVLELENTLRQYEQRVAEYENRMSTQANFDAERAREDQEKDALIKSLREQVAMWKTKYENIATMYAALRNEHLDLLNKYKSAQKLAQSSTQLMQEKEGIAQQLRAKSAEVQELVLQKDTIRNEGLRVQEASQGKIDSLTVELQQHRARFEELSHSKGRETEALAAQFAAEKGQLEARFGSQARELEELRAKMRAHTSELARVTAENQAKVDEVAILQAGLDQSLAALQQLQQKGTANEADLLGRMDRLSIEHRSQMDRIMDSVLEDCKNKASDAIFDLDSDTHSGNETATAELLLSMIEKLSMISGEFARSFTKHLVDEDQTGSHQAEAIKYANNLAQAVSQLLNDVKGVTRLVEDDQMNEKLLGGVRAVGKSGKHFFHELQSTQMSSTDFTQRPQKVKQCHSELQSSLLPVIHVAEKLAESNSGRPQSATRDTDNLESVVENEMMSASKAIEDAARLLAALLNEDRSADPKLTQADLNVHQAILTSAKAITDAIGRLIVCATHSQQEIVAKGRGTGTKTAFYKKNSRWIEGLISAAKTVAAATKTLVETADGVVKGTKKIEELVVATREVSGATAQLVAASRVKADRGSKTQDKLEVAAKAVTDATRLLAKTVEDLRSMEQRNGGGADVDYSRLTPLEFKKREMEQQVLILTQEKQLVEARRRLAEMRRQGYHKESEVVD